MYLSSASLLETMQHCKAQFVYICIHTQVHDQHVSSLQELVDFINFSWTPYHAVEEASRRLLTAGFQHISEKNQWHVKVSLSAWDITNTCWLYLHRRTFSGCMLNMIRDEHTDINATCQMKCKLPQ